MLRHFLYFQMMNYSVELLIFYDAKMCLIRCAIAISEHFEMLSTVHNMSTAVFCRFSGTIWCTAHCGKLAQCTQHIVCLCRHFVIFVVFLMTSLISQFHRSNPCWFSFLSNYYSEHELYQFLICFLCKWIFSGWFVCSGLRYGDGGIVKAGWMNTMQCMSLLPLRHFYLFLWWHYKLANSIWDNPCRLWFLRVTSWLRISSVSSHLFAVSMHI